MEVVVLDENGSTMLSRMKKSENEKRGAHTPHFLHLAHEAPYFIGCIVEQPGLSRSAGVLFKLQSERTERCMHGTFKNRKIICIRVGL